MLFNFNREKTLKAYQSLQGTYFSVHEVILDMDLKKSY